MFKEIVKAVQENPKRLLMVPFIPLLYVAPVMEITSDILERGSVWVEDRLWDLSTWINK